MFGIWAGSIVINDEVFPMPDNDIQMTIEKIEEQGERAENGAMGEIVTVNIVPTLNFRWSNLSTYDMERLCKVLDCEIPEYTTNSYTPRTLEDRILTISCLLPSGFTTFNAYAGSTIRATLSTQKKFDGQLTRLNYDQYVFWSNVEINIIGIGVK